MGEDYNYLRNKIDEVCAVLNRVDKQFTQLSAERKVCDRDFKNIREDIEEIKGEIGVVDIRLKKLESVPGKRWNTVTAGLLGGIGTGIAGTFIYLFTNK